LLLRSCGERPRAADATLAATSVFSFMRQRDNERESEGGVMPFTLPPLPYEKNGLEPHISADTLSCHHGKHHKTYVDTLNDLVKGTPLAGKGLEEVIKATTGKEDKATIFNNAAQVWNHNFLWQSMKPGGGGKPKGRIADKIETDLGGYDKFAEAFTTAAKTQFGSGWAWLALDGGKLEVLKTGNADLPLAHGKTALLTLDVWEHAYYLDYQNRRPDYIGVFLDHLANWEFAEKNLGKG
jgi:Fe-Mn family superoxide dismutase